ncbi:unnamed protein product [Mytilus edulis]|uniref:Mutator-like transposase domain-containing protein n=1 Tax=Mytilus edulis TaxID=6550 RepID=A0A8S3PZU2_MYTED|nr:unnamed protein product [Mytilus edulis]
MHVCLCPSAIELSSKNQSPIKLVSEERKLGLATVLCAQCEGCHKQFKFCTSPSLPESKRFDVNVRAVWGSIATGNGPSHLNEIMGTMNSPGLSSTSFSAIEQEVGEWWLAALQENMLQTVKKKIYALGANATYKSAALTLQIQEEIFTNMQKEVNKNMTGRRRPEPSKLNDSIAMVSEPQSARVFAFIPGREYTKFQAFSDIFSRLKVPGLHKWITDNKERLSYETI